MSFSVNYDAIFADTSVAQYLADWSAYFGDINHRPGHVIESDVMDNPNANSGGFNGKFLSGTEYAVGSTHTPAAVIAEGDLAYTLFSTPAHTFYGTINSLHFGNSLSKDFVSGNYSIEDTHVSFEGLGDYLHSAKTDGHVGIVHQAMYGLMSGDATVLTDALDHILADYGVSTANTFDEVAAAISNAPQHAVADATPVGVTDVVDDYAIAA